LISKEADQFFKHGHSVTSLRTSNLSPSRPQTTANCPLELSG
jgi:hypothetical protein